MSAPPWGLSARICQHCTVPPADPPAPATPGTQTRESEDSPLQPDLTHSPRPWPGLDRLAALQATGGRMLGLIALFSSYDHLTMAGRPLPIPQQRGIPRIASSVATMFIDAQLASRSPLRAAQDAARMADVDTVGRRPWQENARERALSTLIKQHCFPPGPSSIPAHPTKPDCGLSSP